MTPEEFRRHGHEVVDWLADYFANVRDFPVLPATKPGELTDRLPASAPETAESAGQILADFQNLIFPACTLWNHPRFHGFFSISASPPGVLAEMLIAGLNMNGMLWRSSPALTELEQVTLDWLRQWLGLGLGLQDDAWFGIIYDTASTGVMHAIIAARHHAYPEARDLGNLEGLVLYTSDQAHSSVEKGAIAAGIGHRNVRKIATDAGFRLRPDALRAAIEEDLAAGRRPFCIVATVGTTPAAAVDPVPEIVAIAREFGLWLHVDAAYGGLAAVVDTHRHHWAGCEQADSIVVNPHKWLLTPVDLSVLYTRHPGTLRAAFSLVPDYLRTADNPRAVNFMDYGMQLGRRFRALKLWFVMRAYGRQGCEAILRAQLGMARDLAARVEAHPRFELCAPVHLSLVCLRYRGSDEENRELVDRLNQSGTAFLSPTTLNGRFVLRWAIGNFQTTQADIDLVWNTLEGLAAGL